VSASARMLFFVVNTLILFFLGCGTATKEVPVRSRFTVSGKLKLSEQQRTAALASTPLVSLIDENGQRRILPSGTLTFDALSGTFSFAVSRPNFFAGRGLSAAESLASLGQISPETNRDGRSFRKSEFGYLRFEIFSGLENNQSSFLPLYVQRWLPLPALSRFSQNDTLSLESDSIEPVQVSLVRARVLGAQSRPLEGALVTVVPLQNKSTREADAELLDFTREVNFTPIGTRTDGEGKVSLWPVPSDAQGKKLFQVIASADGYCTSTSLPAVAKENNSEVVLQLQECSGEQKNSKDPSWDVSLTTQIAQLEAATATLPLGTYLTNADSVELEFKSKSSVKRGFRVRIFEGTKPEGTLLSQQLFRVYSPRIRVALPTSFKDRTSTRGSFVVLVESLLSEKDVENGLKSPRAIFTFDKIVRNLSTVFSSRFQVIGATGVENVIAGDVNLPFVVKYLDCSAGMKFAISFSDNFNFAAPLVWQTCQPQGNTMTLSELGLTLTAAGGFKNAAFFLKDRYENVSRDDPQNSINRRSNIWFDSGTPDLSGVDLGTELDVVLSNTPLPLTTKPAAVQIQPATVSQYVLAFRQNACTAVPGIDAIADGVDPSLGRGQKINKIFIGTPQTNAQMLISSVSCETAGYALSETRVQFPDAASNSPATFLLTVFDLAGNPATRTYSIPRCTGGAAPAENVCWSP